MVKTLRKYLSRVPRPLFVVGLLLVPSAAAAYSMTAAHDAFHRGIRSFKAGDYAAALLDFEKAKAAGMKQPALFYDLGSTYFKLDRLAEAKSSYSHILNDARYGQYAQYNLGLIAKRQGHFQQARNYFSRVVNEAPDASLRRLAHEQMIQLHRRIREPHLIGFLNIEGGYDSNVLLKQSVSTVTPSGQGSPLLGVLTGGSDLIRGSWNHGLQMTGSFFYRGFSSVSGYNRLFVQAGPKYRFPEGAWNLTASGTAAYFRFGSATLESMATVAFRATRRIATHTNLTLHGSLSKIAGGSQYSYLTGQDYALGVTAHWRFKKLTIAAGYAYQSDNRRNLSAGNQFFNVSPISNQLYGSLHWHFSPHWTASLTGRYEHARYQSPDILVQNGGPISTLRVDNDSDFVFSVKRQLTTALSVGLSAEHENNRSTVRRYSYTENLYILRLGYLFW